MTINLHKILFIKMAIIFAMLTISFSASAVEPKAFAENVANEIVSIIESKKSEDDKQKDLIKLFDKSVDSDWMSKFVLANYYRQLSDDQKSKYSDLYRDFVVYSYIPRFREYGGEKINFYDMVKQGDEYIVKSALKTPKAKSDVLVDYRLKKSGKSYKIIDIIGEGISLITTQRSDFSSAISRKGMDNFFEKLEKRVSSLRAKATK